MKMVVFPGNPGLQYQLTRHNVARRVLEYWPDTEHLEWHQKFHALRAVYLLPNGERCLLLQPENYMNQSGSSVARALQFYKIPTDNLVVVHDELELPFGQVIRRFGGGLAGHNGLRSIRDSIGTTDFHRLRLGIGRPRRGSVSDWVLGRFTPEEECELPAMLRTAAEQLPKILIGK